MSKNRKLTEPQIRILQQMIAGGIVHKTYSIGYTWKGDLGVSLVHKGTFKTLIDKGMVEIVKRVGGACNGYTAWGITEVGKQAINDL